MNRVFIGETALEATDNRSIPMLRFEIPYSAFFPPTQGGRVPILVRPVREQLEHDRVIRTLQLRWKRRFDVVTNIGEERNASVKSGGLTLFPDLVLYATDRGRLLHAVVEVETAESVNHLEAMAQWANLGKARVAFHLYVPANAVEIARRLIVDTGATVAELWSFHGIGDQIRFAMISRSAPPTRREEPRPRATATRRAAKPARPAKRAPRARVPAKSGRVKRTRR